jgi:hypothetical protein
MNKRRSKIYNPSKDKLARRELKNRRGETKRKTKRRINLAILNNKTVKPIPCMMFLTRNCNGKKINSLSYLN